MPVENDSQRALLTRGALSTCGRPKNQFRIRSFGPHGYSSGEFHARSLVDLRFLDAGLFGAAADFRERYELPINRDRDAQTQARLSRRIRPFVLRRLKAQVAPELPDKIEQVAYCSLTEPQMPIYQQVLQASRREILETLGTQSLAKSRLVILNALLRLRQICCDLRLLKLEQVDPSTASAKLDLFGELLDEALEGPPHSRGQP